MSEILVASRNMDMVLTFSLNTLATSTDLQARQRIYLPKTIPYYIINYFLHLDRISKFKLLNVISH